MKHLFRKIFKNFKYMDKQLLIVSLIMIAYGLLIIVTASSREAVDKVGILLHAFQHAAEGGADGSHRLVPRPQPGWVKVGVADHKQPVHGYRYLHRNDFRRMKTAGTGRPFDRRSARWSRPPASEGDPSARAWPCFPAPRLSAAPAFSERPSEIPRRRRPECSHGECHAPLTMCFMS